MNHAIEFTFSGAIQIPEELVALAEKLLDTMSVLQAIAGTHCDTASREAMQAPEVKQAPAQAEPVVQAEPAQAAPEESYTIEQVREAFAALAKSKGKDIARGILSQMGVKSVSDLKQEQFAPAMDLVKGAQ